MPRNDNNNLPRCAAYDTYVSTASGEHESPAGIRTGCGRLFEGTAPQMWASLSKLAALPDDTLVCSGHEYTQANGQVAETIDPNNPALKTRIAEIADARAAGRPTVPSLLSLEKATNPFLRANDANIRRNLGLEQAAAAEVFAEIRGRKDRF